MAPEEQNNTKCSSTSSCVGVGVGGGRGGGSSSNKRASKKLKQKKIPQRGLGVAQLEKLRIEEQQKREAAAEPSVAIFSPKATNNLIVALHSSSNLPLDNNMWQRSLQSSSSSSMVDATSGISPTLSSVMHYQVEPPSNQSYYGNNFTQYWPEEERTTPVLKRQYPFSLEIPPSSSVHSRSPFTFVSQLTTPGESASYSHASPVEDLQGTNTIIRGSSSSGRTISGKDCCLDYDPGFLTLAPPTPTHANQQLPRTTEVCNTGESTSGSYGQQPFYCFLPTPNLENGQIITSESNCDTVDLNLKL